MILEVVQYGDSALREKCEPVLEITDEIRQLAKDLEETVLDKNGAGLAAPQVGRPIRMFVIVYDSAVNEEGRPVLCPPKFYLNPKLSDPSEEKITLEEGCLSIPGFFGEVERPESITVEAMDLEGKVFTERVDKWRARVIMHENDHLNGVLFMDRLDPKIKNQLMPKIKEAFSPEIS